MRTPLIVALFAALTLPAVPHAVAQASALPSANPDANQSTPDRGKKLLDEMLAALGGEKYLARTTWVEYGQTAHFYKSTPDPYVVGFEEYFREQPFAERSIHIEHIATLAMLGLPGRNHHDVAIVWNDKNGYEVTYRGKKELPKEDVAEFERVQAHSLDRVVRHWMRDPGAIITYDGSDLVGRRLADKVSITDSANDTVTLALEESTHLPLSLTFKSRNETYHDFDTETVEWSDYHDVQGIMTPLTVSRYKNGELVSQRFLKKVDYNVQIAPDLFDPDRPLHEDVKKK